MVDVAKYGNGFSQRMPSVQRLVLLSAFWGAFTAFAGVRSGDIFLDLEPEKSSFWHTATNNVMELPVVYPEGASSAELTVTGIGFSRKYEGITGCMPWDWILMC